MAEFFAELKRRQMYRVAAAYALVAWILLQLVNNLTPALKLPDWAATFVVILLIVGFPVALLFCWIQHLPAADGAAPAAKIGKADWPLIGALVVVLLFMGYQQLTRPEAGVDAARSASLSPRTGVSVAVLPFTNLSSEPEQEFFSDGITEEITSALARVPDLRVVARTSAFEFKGQNRNIQSIGQQLNATHLIEGSVRTAGERVRITAQLINASDGTHIWSENYDRELTDIFAIQEDIARAIATSLRMPLGLSPGENLVSSRNIDPEIYQEFLRIRAKGRTALGNANRLESIEGLEHLLARAPNFAKAWAYLSGQYLQSQLNDLYYAAMEPAQEVRQQLLPIYEKTERAAREAIRLDQSEAVAYGTLASVEYHRNNWIAAEDFFRKGLEVDPYGSDLLLGQALFLNRTGRVKQAFQLVQENHALEPLIPSANFGLAWGHVANNQPNAAIALLEGRQGIGNFAQQSVLGPAYAMSGQFHKAADSILQMGRGQIGMRLGRGTFDDMARLMRNAPQKVADPKALPPLHEMLNFVYAYVGAEDRLLDFAERSFEVGLFGELRYLFNPVYSPARKTERFKTLVRKAGLVEYWRARGWADMCHPTTGDDFVCD